MSALPGRCPRPQPFCFFATLITLIAVVPIFFITSIQAALVQTLAVSYVMAVLAALVVSLTVTPALSIVLLSNAQLEHRESRLIVGLQRGYEKFLAGFTRSLALLTLWLWCSL